MTAKSPYISELYIYPIKSCGGMSVSSTRTGKYGLQYDRQWMIIDEDNKFITQRNMAALALLNPTIDDTHLTITTPDGMCETIDITQPYGNIINTNVWEDAVTATDCGKTIAEFLSDYCKQNVRLVTIGNTYKRTINSGNISFSAEVGFADSYPILLISQVTLDDLNQRLDIPIPMNRFRPNIVICGGIPYQEDSWKKISTDTTILYFGKRCSRCVITTIDQKTGLSTGKEPLQTLASYNRDYRGKVMFGSYWAYQNDDTLFSIGDSVHILE